MQEGRLFFPRSGPFSRRSVRCFRPQPQKPVSTVTIKLVFVSQTSSAVCLIHVLVNLQYSVRIVLRAELTFPWHVLHRQRGLFPRQLRHFPQRRCLRHRSSNLILPPSYYLNSPFSSPHESPRTPIIKSLHSNPHVGTHFLRLLRYSD